MSWKLNHSYEIVALKESILSAKLLAMGILPGSKLRLLRKGPLGNVYFALVDNSRFALRANELSEVIVKDV